MGAVEKSVELRDGEPDLAGAPDAQDLPPLRGEIRFDDVSFAYGGEDGAFALRGIDMTVPPGQTVALVGATGAGKSTLVNLVARFYDPAEGRGPIDDHDLRPATQRSPRDQLRILPQH